MWYTLWHHRWYMLVTGLRASCPALPVACATTPTSGASSTRPPRASNTWSPLNPWPHVWWKGTTPPMRPVRPWDPCSWWTSSTPPGGATTPATTSSPHWSGDRGRPRPSPTQWSCPLTSAPPSPSSVSTCRSKTSVASSRRRQPSGHRAVETSLGHGNKRTPLSPDPNLPPIPTWSSANLADSLIVGMGNPHVINTYETKKNLFCYDMRFSH